MELKTFLAELVMSLARLDFVASLELRTEVFTVKGRVHLTQRGFLEVYFNERTQTVAVAWIEAERRRWGIDRDNLRGWHRQPLENPEDPASPYNFELHNLDYTRAEDTSEYTKKGEYRLLAQGFVDLPTQVEAEDVTVEFERAVTGEHTKFKTQLQHKTYSVEEVAERMFRALEAIDRENAESLDPKDHTSYTKTFPLETCEQIVRESLKRAKIKTGRITDENRQKFLQALDTLRRKSAKRVIYKLSPMVLITLNISERQAESCSAAELKKYEFAVEHFQRLNEWRQKDGSATRYQFNMLTPRGYGILFTKLREGELAGFRSELDVAMTRATVGG